MATRHRRSRAGLTVALTGSRAGLGRQLARRFAGDPDCRGVVLLDGPPLEGTAERVRGYDIDIAGPGADARLARVLADEKADALIHAAFFAAPTHQIERMHELESTGTMNVLAACEESAVPRLILWSQTFLYGARPDNPALLSESWPLRASADNPFLRDKLQAELQVAAFAARVPRTRVVVLRTAPVLGPHAEGLLPALLRRRLVPVAAGFDPLLQVLHEYDVLDACKCALTSDAAGTYNVVAGGVLPVTTALLLAGRVPLPIPPAALRRLLAGLWAVRAAEASEELVDFLMYPCVADGAAAARDLGFHATYSTQEAICDYVNRMAAAPPPDTDGATDG